jgi:copper chaperone CopZ
MKSIMKITQVFPVLLGIAFLFPAALSAQQKADAATGQQVVSFKVTGVCGECKARIESTAMDVKGVKKAEWDVQTDMLVLVGSPKMDKQKVAEALAKAGHKSELMAADPKAYAKLPACCQYDSGAEKH